MAAVCAMLALASCGNDIELTEAQAPVKGEYKVTFTASQESSATRTALNGTDVEWNEDDTITVFDGAGANRIFEFAKYAVIDGQVVKTIGEFDGTITVTEPKSYCAVYPAVRNATIDSDYGISGLSLPVEQVATPDGFDPMAAIMTARNDNADKITSTSEDLSLGEFKHVCAFVKVTTTEEYDKITFTAKGGERIAGGFTAYVGEGGVSSVEPDDNASTTVSLVPASGETTIAAGTYLIAVLPGTLAEGFTMSCSKDDVEHSKIITMMRSYNGAVGETVFARHNVVNMGTVEETATAVTWVRSEQEYVDLGLSVKWATCNVGATTPEGYGDYFAWGETSPKDNYYMDSYDDDKALLNASNDAACVNWGSAWHMPTQAEYEELYNWRNCEWERTSQNNVNGYKVTSKKEGYTGKSIFLPAAGYRDYKLVDAGSKGYYRLNTLISPDVPFCVHTIYFEYDGDVYWEWNSETYAGLPIRPVCCP